MRIAVGAITRQRPKAFGELLDSFAAMQRPEGAEVVFLFAENDESHQVSEVVERFRTQVPERVLLDLEPTPGIPMARDHVLQMALDEGADFLTFVDDDETVAADWLVRLVGGVEARGLDLAGGPVLFLSPEEGLTPWNEAVMKHLQYRAGKRIRERAAMAASGTDGEANIYTNNWCLRLAAQRELGVRFDKALQFTGGSDTKFSRDMKAAGARIGWIPEAVVQEVTPARRLTLGYHYSRARDQAINAVVLNNKGAWRATRQSIIRALDAALLVLASPVLGRYGIAKAAHKLGMAVGQVQGAFGGRSSHYEQAGASFHTE